MTIDASERSNAAGRLDVPAPYRRDASVPFRRVGTLSSTERDPESSETAYFIKTSGKDVLQFGEKEYFLWRLLDGTNSIADIQTKFKARFGTPLTPDQFDSFVNQLVECGAVEPYSPVEAALPEPDAVSTVLSTLEQLEPELPRAARRVHFGIPLFDPSGALRALDLICGPLRFFRWLLLPALVGALVCVALYAPAIAAELAALQPRQALGLGAIAWLAVGILPPLSQAVVASFLGYATPACRIAFRWWIWPRLAFDDGAWRTMLSRHVLTVVAAPCVARLVLFIAGTGIWLAASSPGDLVPVLALITGLLGLLSFLISAAPFLPSQGRLWLATLFDRPNPWTAGGGYRLHALFLSLFWLAAAVAVLLVTALAGLPLAYPGWHEPSIAPTIQAAALPLLAIIPVVTRLWIAGMANSHGALQPSYAYAGGAPEALDPSGYPEDRDLVPSRALIDAGVATPRRSSADRWPSTTPIVIWAIVLGLAVAVAFIPYPYEAGGNFTLLPYDKVQINARVAGELTEVLVGEGDRVEPGQLLGTLSDWDARHNLENSRAQLENAKAALQVLYETPRPEDVELARKQYEAALAKLPYDKAQYERYAALVTTDAVSRANYEQVLSTYQQDQAAADVARANYDQLRAGSTPAQIEQARASVRQYTAAVAFYEDQLERTRIRATSAGKVVTANPQLLRGQWYNPSGTSGALIFTVEDQHIVQADIYVPETDIGHVLVGGTVRIRPWGYPKETFTGTASAIAGDAQTDPNGGSSSVIRVRAKIPNPDGRLKPTMAGYAKLDGVYLPTWEAFTQSIIRFFRVGLWSWIP